MGEYFSFIITLELGGKGGDLLNSKAYYQTDKSSKGILSDSNLQDVYRMKNTIRNDILEAQPNKIIRKMRCRFDYWFSSDILFDHVVKNAKLPQVFSDHSPI